MKGIEPFLQWLRNTQLAPHIPDSMHGGTVIDLGCDLEYSFLRSIQDKVKLGIGVDIAPLPKKHDQLKFLQADIDDPSTPIPLPSAKADMVTMLAVLEHLKYPEHALSESARMLKPGGVLLVAVPTTLAELPLEIMARLGLVRKDMIDQHENYFTWRRLRRLTLEAGFSQVHLELWTAGFVTFMRAIK